MSQEIEQIRDEAAKLRAKDDKHFEQMQIEMQKIQDEKEEISLMSQDKDVKIKNLMKTNLEL